MKYNKVKQLFHQVTKKTLSLILSVSITGSITGCTMNFNTDSKDYESIETAVMQEIKDSGVLENINSLDTSDESIEKAVDEIKNVTTNVEESQNVEFQSATLVRVVDGDTIVVDISGEEYKVRLIGINTPESVAPESYRVENSDEGIAASDYVKTLLANVNKVYLQKDTSDTDQYDRLLRYVWIEMPEDPENINEIAEKMLNGMLLTSGCDKIAEPVTYKPDTHYADDFEEIYQSY